MRHGTRRRGDVAHHIPCLARPVPRSCGGTFATMQIVKNSRRPRRFSTGCRLRPRFAENHIAVGGFSTKCMLRPAAATAYRPTRPRGPTPPPRPASLRMPSSTHQPPTRPPAACTRRRNPSRPHPRRRRHCRPPRRPQRLRRSSTAAAEVVIIHSTDSAVDHHRAPTAVEPDPTAETLIRSGAFPSRLPRAPGHRAPRHRAPGHRAPPAARQRVPNTRSSTRATPASSLAAVTSSAAASTSGWALATATP